nr:hypothetical protein [Abalone asfa-like virus]
MEYDLTPKPAIEDWIKPFQWILDETFKDMDLDKIEGNDDFKKYLTNIAPMTSNIIRKWRFISMKYWMPLYHSGYDVVCFRVTIPETNIRSNYVYFYIHKDKDIPEYVGLGATYISNDGEFRPRFITFDEFNEGCQILTDVFDVLETALLKKIQNNKIEFSVYPAIQSDRDNDRFQYFDNEPLALRSFIALLLCDIQAKASGEYKSHHNEDYIELLDHVVDTKMEKYIWSVLNTHPNRNAVNKFISGNLTGGFSIGQKMIPLTRLELANVHNINFGVWRELYLNSLTTDLVINDISPNFAIFNQWTLILSHQHLYEGGLLAKKMDRSEMLRAKEDDITDESKLQKVMNDAIVYSFRAVLYTSQMVGPAISELLKKIKTVPYLSPAFLELFNNSDVFDGFLFGLCYGCATLHRRLSCVHSDLHLNNVTYYSESDCWKLQADGSGFKKYIEKPTSSYVMGEKGEIDTFVIHHPNGHPCLIDFSKSIIGPAQKKLITSYFGEGFVAPFFEAQNPRIYSTIAHYFPEFYKANKEKIHQATFEQIFNLLTAVDYYALAFNLLIFLKQGKDVLSPPPYIFEQCERMKKISFEFFTKFTFSEQMAGDVVIPQLFDKYRYINWDEDELKMTTNLKVYNSLNLLRYSGSHIDKFPTWARPDKGLEVFKDVIVGDDKWFPTDKLLSKGTDTIFE